LQAGAEGGHGLVSSGGVGHRKSVHQVGAALAIKHVRFDALLLGGR
jgi:hypothetical protein